MAVGGRAKAIRREQSLAGWLAWHIVALDRSKRLPPLEKLIGSRTGEAKAQTPMEMEESMARWARTYH